MYYPYRIVLPANISKLIPLSIKQTFQKDKFQVLDGLRIQLFWGCYEFNENDLPKVVEYSHTTGQILSYFNITFLTLIPNIDDTSNFECFRPI
jgi:hypothetical protein